MNPPAPHAGPGFSGLLRLQSDAAPRIPNLSKTRSNFVPQKKQAHTDPSEWDLQNLLTLINMALFEIWESLRSIWDQVFEWTLAGSPYGIPYTTFSDSPPTIFICKVLDYDIPIIHIPMFIFQLIMIPIPYVLFTMIIQNSYSHYDFHSLCFIQFSIFCIPIIHIPYPLVN